MKSYTDLEQSKKLAEFLPLESADMFYADLLVGSTHQYISHHLETYGFETFEDTKQKEYKHLSFLPCWSLAALLSVLPFPVLHMEMLGGIILWSCECHFIETDEVVKIEHYDNPVDACVEMMLNLKKKKLL